LFQKKKKGGENHPRKGGGGTKTKIVRKLRTGELRPTTKCPTLKKKSHLLAKGKKKNKRRTRKGRGHKV